MTLVAMSVLVGPLVGLLAGLVMKAGGYGRRWDLLLALGGASWEVGSPGGWGSLWTRGWWRW